jgi:nucleoside-triphosphatase
VNIFLTGQPHSGKTTLLAKLLASKTDKYGFVTEEIPDPTEAGKRLGFDVIDHTGRRANLAHVDSDSPLRVSKYGVNLEAFEAFLDPLFQIPPDKLLYIDEIGQMELFSDKFKTLVSRYLESERNFMGTISMVFDDPFIEKIRDNPNMKVIEVTPANRGNLLLELGAQYTQ